MKFLCANCEAVFLRWEGRCSNCGEWGTLEEYQASDSSDISAIETKSIALTSADKIASTKSFVKNQRLDSGSEEFNRVLGGGVLVGSVTLISGEPGVGKS